jgi:RND family efflux transporter MFP subunit
MIKKGTLLKIIIPIVIIAAGFGIMKFLIAHREEPKKEISRDAGLLVEVITATRMNHRIVVSGTGTVRPAREISVIPQVSGTVVFVSPNLKAGGFFKKGEILLKIDDRDYRLALERAVSAKAKAEVDLATVQSRADIARREWERISSGSRKAPSPLVTYEPQLKSARAALAAAEAAVQQARLDLERTTLTAPFNLRVRSENIDEGQYVRAGTSVALVAGTAKAEISVPMSIDDMRWLKIQGRENGEGGSSALVRLNAGGKVYEWEGRLVRSTGEVNPRTRMIDLVVEVSDPYGISAGRKPDSPPLASGSFVTVDFMGDMLENVFVIPIGALRDGPALWIADESDRLMIRKVSPLRIEKDAVILTRGLKEGERIVLSNISGAADGMKLRVGSTE